VWRFGRDQWFAAAALLVAVVSAARSIACQQLSARYVPLVERRLTAAALRPRRLDRLEDPLVAARLAAASAAGREGVHAMAVDSFSSIVQARTVGVASLVILVTWSWWPPVALLVGYLLVGDRYRRWQKTRFGELLVVSGGERRRAEYFRRLLVDASPAAEVRALGLGRWLSDRYASTWRQAMLPVWRSRRHAGGPLTLGLVLMVVNGAIVAAGPRRVHRCDHGGGADGVSASARDRVSARDSRRCHLAVCARGDHGRVHRRARP